MYRFVLAIAFVAFAVPAFAGQEAIFLPLFLNTLALLSPAPIPVPAVSAPAPSLFLFGRVTHHLMVLKCSILFVLSAAGIEVQRHPAAPVPLGERPSYLWMQESGFRV